MILAKWLFHNNYIISIFTIYALNFKAVNDFILNRSLLSSILNTETAFNYKLMAK